MSIETNLKEEVLLELDELSKAEFGSEKYKTGVSGVMQLTDRLIEMSKMDSEDEKVEEDKKDRKTKNRISVLSTVLPSVIAVVGGAAMFIYEERGSITSQTGRKIIDKYIFRVK